MAYYDRILVMDRGEIAEFDSPLALFDRELGIFRSLCDTKVSGIQKLVLRTWEADDTDDHSRGPRQDTARGSRAF